MKQLHFKVRENCRALGTMVSNTTHWLMLAAEC